MAIFGSIYTNKTTLDPIYILEKASTNILVYNNLKKVQKVIFFTKIWVIFSSPYCYEPRMGITLIYSLLTGIPTTSL